MKTDVVSFHNIDELNLVIIYWHNGEYSISELLMRFGLKSQFIF